MKSHDWLEVPGRPGQAFSYLLELERHSALVTYEPSDDFWHVQLRQLFRPSVVIMDTFDEGLPGWDTADDAMKYAQAQLEEWEGSR